MSEWWTYLDLVNGLYLCLLGMLMSTQNLRSFITFKAFPFVIGVLIIVRWTIEYMVNHV